MANYRKGIVECDERLQKLTATADGILSRAELENRGMTAAENRDYEGLLAKIKQTREDRDGYMKKVGLEEETLRQARGEFSGGRGPRYSNGAWQEGNNTGTGPAGDVFKSFGEQLQAVASMGKPGARPDERLYQVMAASGASESVPSDGGFLVESQFSNEILRRAYDVGAVASRCRKIPIGANANGVSIPYVDETSRATGSRWGGVQVYRVAEAETVAAKKPKFGRLDCKLEKMMGLAYVTDELLSDASALGAVMSDAFSEEIDFKLTDEIFNGTGAGECLGILQSPALVTVAKEVGQAADSVIYDNIIKMWSRMHARSRKNAVWYINQDVEPQLFQLRLEVGTGGAPVWLPAGGVSGSPYSTLMGRPVIPVEQCATLGDVGDIVLADFDQYLLIDKTPTSDVSMHVRFVYDEMAFRFVYRVNGLPIWKSALTPYKGANTLSPFVTLAARA